MKINLKAPILNLKGEVMKHDGAPDVVFTVGDALANVLLNSKAGGKMKLFVLAQKLYSDETIDLDEADTNLVKKSVVDSETYGVLILGQLELMLNKQ